MGTPAIPRDMVRALWMDPSLSVEDIAERLGCAPNSASRIAANMGLPRRKDIYARQQNASQKPEVPAPTGCAFKDAIRATGGRYVALDAVAKAHGITLRRAQQEWHRVRP